MGGIVVYWSLRAVDGAIVWAKNLWDQVTAFLARLKEVYIVNTACFCVLVSLALCQWCICTTVLNFTAVPFYMCVWEWRLDGHLTWLSDVRFLKSMLIIFINIIKEMMLLISVLLALYVVFRGLFLIYISLKDKWPRLKDKSETFQSIALTIYRLFWIVAVGPFILSKHDCLLPLFVQITLAKQRYYQLPQIISYGRLTTINLYGVDFVKMLYI